MKRDELLEAARSIPEVERASVLAEATQDMSDSGQQVVARQGINKGAWPQESKHRMLTILGSLAAALIASVIAVWAGNVEAESVGTAVVALGTAIVGGIFGYAQGSK